MGQRTNPVIYQLRLHWGRHLYFRKYTWTQILTNILWTHPPLLLQKKSWLNTTATHLSLNIYCINADWPCWACSEGCTERERCIARTLSSPLVLVACHLDSSYIFFNIKKFALITVDAIKMMNEPPVWRKLVSDCIIIVHDFPIISLKLVDFGGKKRTTTFSLTNLYNESNILMQRIN